MQPVRCSRLLVILCSPVGILTSAACASAQVMDQPFPNASQTYSQFDLSLNSDATQSATTAGGATFGQAMSIGSSGSPGVYGNQTKSQSMPASNSMQTNKQLAARLQTRTVPLDRVFGGGRTLPPTRLDSFVKNAAGSADLIYGDEGTMGPPPFFDFDASHRIERGVHSNGLTTGHKGNLPEAWGWPQ